MLLAGKVMAPLPVAKGEISHCPLVLDSYVEVMLQFAATRTSQKGCQQTLGDPGSGINQQCVIKIETRRASVSFYTMGQIWSLQNLH